MASFKIINIHIKQNGFALPIVLAFLALGAIVIGPFLYHAGTTLISSRDYGQIINEEYAADAGVEHAIWKITNGNLGAQIPVQGTSTSYTLPGQVNILNPYITVTNGGSSGDNLTNYHIQSAAGSQSILASVNIGSNSVKVLSWQYASSSGSNNIPFITSLSPASKNIGDGAFTLTVNGSDFVTGAAVSLNGSIRTTTFISSTQLAAAIPASDLAAAATYAVTVTNPAPGGGTSNAQTFTVADNNPTITVQFKDSAGRPLSGGIVQYYYGYWQVFGTTDANGLVSKKLVPGVYIFSMNYAYGRQEKSQNVAVNPTVLFQTARVTVQLRDSTGTALDTGTVQYYSGGWLDIGSTSGGNISKELLPLTYSFSMNYAYGRQEKSQNVAVNPTVLFQTGKIHSNSGSCSQYYASEWRTFNQDQELLPLTYTFHYNDGQFDQSYSIISGVLNSIH